jgi:hypothetical protein
VRTCVIFSPEKHCPYYHKLTGKARDFQRASRGLRGKYLSVAGLFNEEGPKPGRAFMFKLTAKLPGGYGAPQNSRPVHMLLDILGNTTWFAVAVLKFFMEFLRRPVTTASFASMLPRVPFATAAPLEQSFEFFQNLSHPDPR